MTNPALDPVSKIPELKVCAVRVEKAGEDEAPTTVDAAEPGDEGGGDDLDDLF